MSGFAPINNDLSYWQKQTRPLFNDLTWNIPEQKTGSIVVVGGNSQSFSSVIRTAEYLNQHFPIKHVSTLLPEALRSKLPNSENLNFAAATTSGTFAKSYLLEQTISDSNFTILAGDLSRNAETTIAITDAVQKTTVPLLITRDSVDLLAPSAAQILNRPNLFIFGSLAQIQKIFRAIYYPRMIMLSQPLVPIIETLHKFTLTYPVTLITFHQEQIIVANNGNISTTPLKDTSYSPIMLWSGQLAAKIAALNLFNPNQPFAASTAALLY